MQAEPRTIRPARLLWPLALGLGLTIGVLLAFAHYCAVEARAVSAHPPVSLPDGTVSVQVIDGDATPVTATSAVDARAASALAGAPRQNQKRSHNFAPPRYWRRPPGSRSGTSAEGRALPYAYVEPFATGPFIHPPASSSRLAGQFSGLNFMASATHVEGFVVDLAYDVVWGYVAAGDLVTVSGAMGGAAYGAAEADGVGFFWTPLWQSNGQPAQVEGHTLEVYVNGTLSGTITPLTVTGHVDTLKDEVVGSISGASAGTPVTVTLGVWAFQQSLVGGPQITTTTDVSGVFTGTFLASDLRPVNFARVEYAAGPNTVHGYVYPREVFNIDTFTYLVGYAVPGQLVPMTVYVSQTSDVRWSGATIANWPHGDYAAQAYIEPGDVAAVDLGGGTVITAVASDLTAHIDVHNERVVGTCPPNKRVRVWAWNWRLGIYAETSTLADASGNYTATFTGYDLRAGDGVYPAFADDEGDEVLLSTNAPAIIAYPDQDGIQGLVDAANAPYTATLYHDPDTHVLTGTTKPRSNNTGWIDFGVDVAPGDIITLETADWTGVMTVTDLDFDFDTANDRVLGEANIPGWMMAWAEQWIRWQYPVCGAIGVSTTLSSSFTATLPRYDLRDGCRVSIAHYDANDFATWVDRQLRYFELWPPYGVGAPQLSPTGVLTATLYESDGLTVKRQTSQDRDDKPDWYWLEMEGDIAVGDWITVTGDEGWRAGLEVPALTVRADTETDLIWGQGPKALLFVEHGWKYGWDGHFVPVDDYALDRAFFGAHIQDGDWIATTYQAPNGNRVRQRVTWPQMRVNYGHDWVGGDYEAGHTFWITVTDSAGGVKATTHIDTLPGGGWGGPGFETKHEEWSPPRPDIGPGDWVYLRADDGYSNAIRVGTITGELDLGENTVSGTINANWFTETLQVHCEVWVKDGPDGIDTTAEPDGGSYFCDFDDVGWDLLPGQDVAVRYSEPDNDLVINVFRGAAANLWMDKKSIGQPGAGGNFAYWIHYGNDGDAEATDVVLTDTLPLSTSYVADASGFPANINGQVITWSLGTVPVKSQARFLFVLAVDPDAGGTLHNEVEIHTLYDYDDGNNSASRDDDIQPTDVDLWVNKSNDHDWPAPGYDFTYRIDYGNNGSTGSDIVTLTDTLPLSTTFVSWDSNDPLWNLVGVVGNQAVFTRPVIPGHSGDSLYLTLHLSDGVAQGTTLTDTVDIATPNETGGLQDNVCTHTMEAISPYLNIHVHKDTSHGTTTVADYDIAFWIRYYNDSNTPAYDVLITDTLPAGTTFVTSTIQVWRRGDWRDVPFPPAFPIPSQAVWHVGTLNPGEEGHIRIVLHINPTVASGTPLTNEVKIAPIVILTYSDVNPKDDHDALAYTVRDPGPNLMVDKRGNWQGGPPWQIAYDFLFHNIGTEPINGFTITDTYPLFTTFAKEWVWWSNNYTFTYDDTEHQAIWEFADSIPLGDVGGGGLTVDMDPGIGRGRILTNVMQITIPPGDVYPADNSCTSVKTTGPDLYVSKTAPCREVEAGEVLTFTLRYGNAAQRWEDHTDWSGTVLLQDTLPAGMQYLTSTQRFCDGPHCPYVMPSIFPGNQLIFDIGPQGDGWWNEIYLRVRIAETAQLGDLFTNRAVIASSRPLVDVEPYEDNNSSIATVSIREYESYLPVTLRSY